MSSSDPFPLFPEHSAPVAGDEELVARVRAGDVDAFASVVNRHVAELVGFAQTHLNSRESAEDLVQDVLLNLWTLRERWTVQHSIRAYLFGAIRKRIITYRLNARREDRRLELRPAEEHPSAAEQLFPGGADDALDEAELEAAYQRAVATLPDRCRQVFLLQRQQQLTYAEVATALGISVKTVEIHMGKALTVLRKTLADWLR
jgi:RNA polymerase sigma-70 factor, ECF subfamily